MRAVLLSRGSQEPFADPYVTVIRTLRELPSLL
jgi:hypothetical protein